MLNPKLELRNDIFDQPVFKPIRDGYGEALVELGEKNQNIIVLCADLAESTRSHWFKEKFPERFIEIGIAEQNMAGVGAGLGVSGKCVFLSSYAVFSPYRNWEQIRTTICYNNANVKIAGHHAGLVTGKDGATHQALEDIALMRVLPNIKVIVPADALEAKKATIEVTKFYGPAYLRFEREKSPLFTTEKTPFSIGKASVFWIPESKNQPLITIIACGSVIYQALLSAKELEKEKIGVFVINCSSIKPIDQTTILKIVKTAPRVITIEDHQINGGLGSAIAELLIQNFPVKMEMIGVNDQFGQSGEPDELLKFYQLTKEEIFQRVEKLMKFKQ